MEISKITTELYTELTIEEAYLVQKELINQKLKEEHTISRLKMGITSKAKMKQMNVDDPIYGYVFDNMVVEERGSITISDYIHPKVEPEIGFILGRGPVVTILASIWMEEENLNHDKLVR